MINFNIISPKSRGLGNLNTSELKIKTPQNSKIAYPIDNGKVISVNQDECGGNVIISFSYEGLPYLINFCGISDIRIKNGSSVKEGNVLGYNNKNKIYVYVLDSKNKKVNLTKFGEKRDGDSRDYNDDKSLQVALKTSLFPMTFAHDVFSDLLGVKNNKLKEEISRIKKLL